MAKKTVKPQKFTANMAANTMVVSGYIGSVKCDDEGNCIEDNTGQGLMERFADMIEGQPTECTVIFRACYGGSVYDGIPLANAMLAAIQSGIKVITVIEGIAASMAGFCFLHGEERLIDRLSRWHVHRPSSGTYGTWEELEAQVENLKSLEADIIARIAERTGKTAEWVAANWCDGPDHELGATECIKHGVATRIIESTIVPVEADDMEADSPDMLAKKLLPLMQAPKQTEPNNTEIMFTPEFKQSIGLPADATDEQVNAKVAAGQKAIADLATMTAAKEAEDKAVIEAEVKMLVDANVITRAEAPGITETFMKLGVAGAKMMAAKMQPRKPVTQMLAEEKAKGEQSEHQKLVSMSVKELDAQNKWVALQAADEDAFQAKYFEKHGKYFKNYKPGK